MSAMSAGSAVLAFDLNSNAFSRNSDIPRRFTCEGPNVSPALSWGEPPSGTQSFSLIMDDPDAPARTWVHWVLYDLPGSARGLPEGVSKAPELKDGSRQGRNDFGRTGYEGPCPPHGPAHRYSFRLFALNTRLNLKAGATKVEVERAMKGHVLAQAELVGKYKR
jgi:Raf kinase inhibitor-like YbhB/YbcL family protein